MANAAEHKVGRSGGHDWAVFMAASGHICWPLMGTNHWPLTARLRAALREVAGKHPAWGWRKARWHLLAQPIYNHERPHGSLDGMTPKRYWENWTQENQLAIA
ncbi:hypothetical protein OOZ51_21900 [Arthrobacter sp. MI7-26]|uniref:hypothetical protein n=1 Tax=Arthrobacter sp. MI7-26 TaxID=2993653 RepID=UPI002248DDC6|nr:hypothetical protein [Arthrobacter sp. MI7-26]MCX2750437.1 hypothetical protein [Arthrobacter sp. MI7-26]